MIKGDKVRSILGRSEWMFNAEIAQEAGCTSARVCQIIDELETEGRTVQVEYVGHRARYRMLTRDEERQREVAAESKKSISKLRAELLAVESAVSRLRAAIDGLVGA